MSDDNREVRVVRRGHVLEITLDRPKVNAIDIKASHALGEAFVLLRDDPSLRVGILTAAGDRVFSAGWVYRIPRWWKISGWEIGGLVRIQAGDAVPVTQATNTLSA